MPFGIKRVDKEKSIILYYYDRDNQTNMTGYQPNVIWVLTVIADLKIIKEKIENSLKIGLEYNNDITHFGKTPKFPTHFGPFLIINKVMPMMGYNTNMDSMANLKFTIESAMQQLIDTVKKIINNPSNSEKSSEPEDTFDINQNQNPSSPKERIFD
ncbi:6472_t:CDS:2 [Cetraspora pellucida]|uniref:6472_t:CDS:1 n=1 Tax=Cetraspora pellucida TaxID=1433469 RepID=A0A9N9GYV3_9GLOM|nr:6472_t:CDS:2 [Cetraspora pellucida]